MIFVAIRIYQPENNNIHRADRQQISKSIIILFHEYTWKLNWQVSVFGQ